MLHKQESLKQAFSRKAEDGCRKFNELVMAINYSLQLFTELGVNSCFSMY